MIIQGKVNPPSNVSATDGVQYDLLQGKSSELITTQLHGKYYTQAYRGNVFIGSTAAAGVTLPAFSATAVVFALWNNPGSGWNAVPISCAIGYVSGTAAPSNFVYGYVQNIGTGLSTPVTAFTAGTPVNAYLGSGVASRMRFTPSAATLSSAAASAVVVVKTSGISQLTTTAATTTGTMWMAKEDFDGMIIIPPNTMFIVAGNTGTSTVATVSLVWEEVPA